MNKKTQVVPSSSQQNPKPSRSKRVARRQRRQRARLSMSVAPAAIGAKANSYATVQTHTDGSAVLKIREIFPIRQTTIGLARAIPICPTKWTGTRTASIAATYMSHRPLRVSWQYIPATSANTAGSIAVGTVWAGCRLPNTDSIEDLCQYLPCTNGGSLSSVWQPCSSAVSCGRNLRANQFPLYEVSSDDIPFWIVAASDGTAVIGSLVITAEFTLRNPITPGASGPVSYSGNVTFTAEQDKTIFSLPKDAVSAPLSVGQELCFTPLRNLMNRTGSIMTQALATFVASVMTIGDQIQFSVDPNYAAASFNAVLMGRSPNFQ